MLCQHNLFSLPLTMWLLPTAKTLLMALMIFFVSIGPELAKDIHSDINPHTYVNNISNSIAIFVVSCGEVRNIIYSLKNSSDRHDEFPTLETLCR